MAYSIPDTAIAIIRSKGHVSLDCENLTSDMILQVVAAAWENESPITLRNVKNKSTQDLADIVSRAPGLVTVVLDRNS